MRNILFIVFSLFIVCLWGCGNGDYLSLKDYLKERQRDSTKFSTYTTVGGLQITAAYIPSIIMAFREAGSIEALNAEPKDIEKNYQGAEFFDFHITKLDESTKKYLKRRFVSPDSSESSFEEYLDFEIQRDLSLIIDRDTFPCAYLHREISESITNVLNYTLSFELPMDSPWIAKQDQKIVLNSSQLEMNHIELVVSKNQIELLNSIKL